MRAVDQKHNYQLEWPNKPVGLSRLITPLSHNTSSSILDNTGIVFVAVPIPLLCRRLNRDSHIFLEAETLDPGKY